MNDNSAPTNPARRRLARGGLAAPVVLASLTTKNAFAATLPYACFVSGKLSNNLSPYGPNPTGNQNPECPLQSSTTQTSSRLQGDTTTFNSVFNNLSIYIRASNPQLGRLTTSPGTSSQSNTPATLYQVLTGTNATGGNSPVPNLPRAQKYVTIYFNAKGVTTTTGVQPLTQSQALQLINAEIAGTGTTISTSMGDLTLTAGDVSSYINQMIT